MQRVKFATMLLAIVFCAGCDGLNLGGAKSDTPSSAPLAAVPVEQLVRTALLHRSNLNTCRAEGTMQIVDKPGDFSLRVNVDVLAGRDPDVLRIYATKAAIDAFDVVVAGERISLFVPRHKTLYTGTVAEMNSRDGMRFEPRMVLENLLSPDGSLAQKPWRATGPAREWEIIGKALELIEVSDAPQWRVYVDPDEQLLRAVERLTPQGDVEYVKIYDKYRSIAGAGEGEVYPHKVRIEYPGQTRFIEVYFKRLEPNLQLTREMFQMEIPENVRTKPLGQARIESDAAETPAQMPAEPGPSPADADTPSAP